jgi:hypothetical protein
MSGSRSHGLSICNRCLFDSGSVYFYHKLLWLADIQVVLKELYICNESIRRNCLSKSEFYFTKHITWSKGASFLFQIILILFILLSLWNIIDFMSSACFARTL